MQQSIRSRSTIRLKAVGASLVAGLAVGLFAVPSADAAKVRGGESVIKVNRAVVNKLGAQGVSFKATKPATKRRNTVRLGFKRGNFVVSTNNPAPYEPLAVENLLGQGALKGGIRFTRVKRGNRRVATVTGIRVNLRKRNVIGKVQGKRVVLFKINFGWATPEGSALRPRLTAAPIKLTRPAARRLNSRLGANVFSHRSGFGQLNVAPVLAG